MNTIPLGGTGIKITPIGLGCWQFSDAVGFAKYFWPALPGETMREIVRICLEGGVNWFDTAEVYGRGASERALAASLKTLDVKPGSVVIATKWLPALRTARSLNKTIGEREQALSPYPIDLHQVHMPFSFSSIKKQMNAMADLLAEKKIKAVGVSNFSATQMVKAHRALQKRGLVLASNQMRYHLLDRSIEHNGVLEAARDLGITIIAYSPLAQGILTGKFHDNPELIGKRPFFRRKSRFFQPAGLARTAPLIDLLKQIAGAHQVSPAEVSIAWLISRHRGLVAAIPGATKPDHARLNVKAGALKLTEEEIARIDAESLRVVMR
ncbi:MAG TPA: aldo/keto reductase [Spirochaetia bacterium]|nr:aldo/keto reductase [Spirochaetia bacterium]